VQRNLERDISGNLNFSWRARNLPRLNSSLLFLGNFGYYFPGEAELGREDILALFFPP